MVNILDVYARESYEKALFPSKQHQQSILGFLEPCVNQIDYLPFLSVQSFSIVIWLSLCNKLQFLSILALKDFMVFFLFLFFTLTVYLCFPFITFEIRYWTFHSFLIFSSLLWVFDLDKLLVLYSCCYLLQIYCATFILL